MARRSITVQVDTSLSRLAYSCYPNGCPRDRTCCVGLAVAVSRREVRRIDALMGAVARLLPALREEGGYVDVFVEEDGGAHIEPRDERGTCPFLFRHSGHALCAIHHVALQSGRSVSSVKPQACRHWPLVLDSRRGVLRITVHPDAQAIGCVAPCALLPGHPSMREAFAAEIEEIRRFVARRTARS